MKVKLTVLESNCRGNYHKAGEVYIVEDICAPICHELWQCIYPSIYVLLNDGSLDYGDAKAKKFQIKCPDNGRVLIQGELIQ